MPDQHRRWIIRLVATGIAIIGLWNVHSIVTPAGSISSPTGATTSRCVTHAQLQYGYCTVEDASSR